MTGFQSAANSTFYSGIALKTDWTSGAFNPDAVTGGSDSTNYSWAAVTLALRPAPEPPTLYFSAFTSANTPTWDRANVGNGRHGFSATGYASSGSTTTSVPTTGTGNDASVGLTLTGLSPSTEYKLWLVWDDGINTDGPIGSAAFTTSSAGGYTHPTLSNVTATEITATSFQPRVTYQF
jgi:hypothetical protein